MKVNLDKDGKLTVSPSDSIDEYALGKWSEENKIDSDKIVIKNRIDEQEFGFKSKEEKKPTI